MIETRNCSGPESLSAVGGEMVSSLDAQEDLSRKILRKVA